MASEFKIEVPIEVTGKGSSGSGSSGSGPSFGKLSAAVAAGSLASKALSVVMSSLLQLLNPLINVLKALFVVVFLPFMPLITDLTKALGELITGLMKMFGGEIDFVEFIKSYVGPILLDIGKAFFNLGVAIGDALLSVADSIAQWIFDAIIKPIADAITSAIKWIGDKIYEIITWMGDTIYNAIIALGVAIVDIGSWIWSRIIEPAFNFLVDVGSWIWDIIKSPFVWLASKIRSLWNKFNIFSKSSSSDKSVDDAIISPGGQIISTAPDDYLIATKNPQNLGGSSGSVTINVTGNKFNSEDDMKKMVTMISRELSKQSSRSFSR